MNIDWKLVGSITQVLWDQGIITAFAGAALTFAYKYSKNKNIQNFEKWCAQGVLYAQSHFTGSASKKQAAMDFAASRIGHNWFTGFFSNKQISAEVENQLLILKNNGLENLKKVANAAPVHTKAPDVTTTATKNNFPENKDVPVTVAPLPSTATNSVSSLPATDESKTVQEVK